MTTQPNAKIGLVQFFVLNTITNTTTLLGSSTTAPYSINWVPTKTGSYQLWVTVMDNIGDSSTSAPVNVAIAVADPVPGTTCFLSYQLASQWSGGFSANVTINNRGTSTINGWTVQFTFPGDQTITTLWNGSYTQSGQQVTVTNASWNSSIPPGSNVYLGFNGRWTSNNTTPISFTLNGQPCFRQ
jgi:xyloglucan-specific exo-beta-1,4-glucanase